MDSQTSLLTSTRDDIMLVVLFRTRLPTPRIRGAGVTEDSCTVLNFWLFQVDTMQLEDYFEFIAPDDIRIKGHRVGIDDVLQYYLDGYSPEEIAANLPSLTLEEIHATITYYLHNRPQINAYLSRLAAWREARYQEWAANPSPLVERLRAVRTQKHNLAAVVS